MSSKRVAPHFELVDVLLLSAVVSMKKKSAINLKKIKNNKTVTV